MSIGLITMYVINYKQNVKDNSRARWIAGAGEAIKSLAKEVNSNANKEKDTENRVLNSILDALEKKYEEQNAGKDNPK